MHDPDRPYLLIIGAMKCGTSSLFSWLSNHPQIAACRLKEPDFFASAYNRGIDWYSSLWTFDSAVSQVAMEASTGYTKHPMRPGVPARIRAHLRRVRFVYLVRNPLERIESQLNHHRKEGDLQRYPLLEHPSYLNISRYYFQIGLMRESFPDAPFLVLDFEDLRRAPGSVFKRVCGFAGVDATVTLPHYAAAHRTTDKPVSLPGPWRTLEQLLPDRIKSPFREFARHRSNRKPLVLSAAQRDFVLSELESDLQALRREYAIDLSRWGLAL